MSRAKRLRVFAGPNGSGKSTLFAKIRETFETGNFVNSDIIEDEFASKGFLVLDNFGLSLTQQDLDIFFKKPQTRSLLTKAENAGHPIDILIRENVLVDNPKNTHSYEASLIAAFLREHLLNKGKSYAFETVMSHSSKLEEIKRARESGYKTYLYFVCLDDPLLNISRVTNRVQKGGHAVPEDKIFARYWRTLENLLPAVMAADKSFLFDNSGTSMNLVAEVISGQLTTHVDQGKLPNWFIQYLINKL